MIWQEGNENGLVAGKVKNLFSQALTVDVVATPALDAALVVETEVSPLAIVRDVPPPADPSILRPPAVVKKGRATAGKGALIIGQDGKTVKFRMKCTVCSYEDSSWKSLAIPRGTYRTSFYCPKCRKKRDAEINGYW